MPMNDGAMQPYSLTLDKMLDHAAKWHPDQHVATLNADGSVSRTGYAEVRTRAQAVTSALQKMGAKSGDRIATLAWNTQAHMECWYGIMGMGAVCHTLNPRLTGQQLAWMLEQSAAELLIVDEDLLPLCKTMLQSPQSVKQVLIINGSGTFDGLNAAKVNVHALEDLLDVNSAKVVWGDFEETRPCGLCFTSGTTGSPKGVTYTHRALFLHSLRQMQADVSGVTSQDVILPVVPMFHANAWGFPFTAPAAGAKLVFLGRQTDGETLARHIASEGVTIAVGVPTVWLSMFDYLDETGLEVPTLKRIMVGGAPMNAALLKRIEARGITLQTSWGMTELSPLGTATPPSDGSSSSTAGRPAIGVDLLLTDHEGHPLAQQRNVEGHLWVKGSSVVERYFGQTTPATRNGWFPTGDMATIDDKGYVSITGRSKDLIKSGGEWINPTEIESLISTLPEVAFCAVVGREHEKWGERPVLLLQFREGQSLEDAKLLSFLEPHVPSWWLPDDIIRLETMPLASTGKIDKLRLRSDYMAA